jgi:organic hydroperoxide reductase OsmC/OhrA
MEYIARVNWKRHAAPFTAKSFERNHYVFFGGGVAIEASSAPEFLGNPELPNPEELYTASIASCFMLTFLYWASMKNVTVDEYDAEVVGTLAKNAEGKMAMTTVKIKPTIKFHPDAVPEKTQMTELLKKAHDNCFISNSVKTQIQIIYEHPVAA